MSWPIINHTTYWSSSAPLTRWHEEGTPICLTCLLLLHTTSKRKLQRPTTDKLLTFNRDCLVGFFFYSMFSSGYHLMTQILFSTCLSSSFSRTEWHLLTCWRSQSQPVIELSSRSSWLLALLSSLSKPIFIAAHLSLTVERKMTNLQIRMKCKEDFNKAGSCK